MGSSSSWRRVRVERGIYLLPNGKYAALCRRAGRQWYRTVGSDLVLARSAREALIASADAGVAPASPRVRFDTVAGWWLERFEAKVAAGERHPRTLEAHRYHLERHLLPALAPRRMSALSVDHVAALLHDLRATGCSPKTAAGALATCTASFATRDGMGGSRVILSISSKPTSGRVQRGGASACSAAMRSNGCSPRVRRATG